MHAHGLADIVRGSAWQPGPLRPIQFPSWVATCGHLVVAIANGPGLILLVGAEGCGKTYTLVAVATGTPRRETAIRNPGEAIRPGIAVDMVDDVEADAIDGLLEPPLGLVRVLAVHPDLVPAVRTRRPDARVVPVQPMSRRDVRAFVEVRRSELPAPVDGFVLRALAKLPECGVRTPGIADRLIERICDEAAAQRSRRATSPWRGQIETDAWATLHRHDTTPPFGRHPPEAGPVRRPPEPSGSNPTPYVAGVGATFQAPASRFRRGVGAMRRRNLPHQAEPIFDATSWDMLQTVPAVIEQVGPSVRARRRTRLIGAGGLVLAATVALTVAGRPDLGAGVARLRDGSALRSAWPGPAMAPHVAFVAAPPGVDPQPGAAEPRPALALDVQAPAADAFEAGSPRRPATITAAADVAPPVTILASAGTTAGMSELAAAPPTEKAGPASDQPAGAPPAPVNAEPPATRFAAVSAIVPAAAPAAVVRRPTPEPKRGDTADPARLLHLGQMLLAIGQEADGRKMLEASAEHGNAEAASLIAAHGWARPARGSASRGAARASSPAAR